LSFSYFQLHFTVSTRGNLLFRWCNVTQLLVRGHTCRSLLLACLFWRSAAPWLCVLPHFRSIWSAFSPCYVSSSMTCLDMIYFL